MTTTFKKEAFNVDNNDVAMRYEEYYKKAMPSNYRVHVSVSQTNGLSVYVSFFREGENKDFEVRHSNHMNGFGYGIHDTMFSYKSNSLDLQPNEGVVKQVLHFYGDDK